MMTSLYNASVGLCLVALFVSVVALFAKPRWVESLSLVFMGAANIAQTAYIIVRWQAAGRAPFSNMFESLVLFAWAIVFIYLCTRVKFRLPVLGSLSMLMALLTLAYASTFTSEIKPLMPALQSNWLTIHVFTCFLGYAGFAVSFVASIAYLVSSGNFVYLGRAAVSLLMGKDLSEVPPMCLDKPELSDMEIVVVKAVSFGFLFLTIGIITGSVWANYAWGTYWSWDPKETWSLITWFIYAAFLHCRYMRGWRGVAAVWISVLGFASVLFTYIGVNFLLSGLHSYA